MKTSQFILTLSLSALLGGGMALSGYKLMEMKDDQIVGMQSNQQHGNMRLASNMPISDMAMHSELSFVQAAEIATPAVVHVTTEYKVKSQPYYDPLAPFLRDFFGENYQDLQRQAPPRVGSGSGVIVSANGYIVTNNHVIEKADKIEVVMDDKRKFTATLVGTDPNTDLAVLKVEAENLPFLSYGNSDELKVGQWVLAVGNPFNLTSTVTAGIVSAKGRNINILREREMGIESFIQTDAAVNPGNSGGALVNLRGELVGINTAIASQTGSFTGYSFAVPAAIVSKVIDDLLKFGEVQRALLGVAIREVDAALAAEKKIKDLSGVYIMSVGKSSAAAEAGLEEGDVITQINGVNVNTVAQLQEQVARYRPGDKIKVNFTRDNKPKSTTVTLKSKAGDIEIVKREPGAPKEISGATFEAISKHEQNKLGISGGVKITGVKGSRFKDSGIKDGFIITRIDKTEVFTPKDVEKIISESKGGILVEGIYPDGKKAYYAFSM